MKPNIKELKKIITRKNKQIDMIMGLGMPMNKMILELYADVILAEKEIMDIRLNTLKKIML